mmetsp:Transcript_39203/g.73547  ORF Transcript_39203/g.73547 Transcript_39203/m.73547 type:complete len:396 (+) Transcript_39203:680-1867(+)
MKFLRVRCLHSAQEQLGHRLLGCGLAVHVLEVQERHPHVEPLCILPEMNRLQSALRHLARFRHLRPGHVPGDELDPHKRRRLRRQHRALKLLCTLGSAFPGQPRALLRRHLSLACFLQPLLVPLGVFALHRLHVHRLRRPTCSARRIIQSSIAIPFPIHVRVNTQRLGLGSVALHWIFFRIFLFRIGLLNIRLRFFLALLLSFVLFTLGSIEIRVFPLAVTTLSVLLLFCLISKVRWLEPKIQFPLLGVQADDTRLHAVTKRVEALWFANVLVRQLADVAHSRQARRALQLDEHAETLVPLHLAPHHRPHIQLRHCEGARLLRRRARTLLGHHRGRHLQSRLHAPSACVSVYHSAAHQLSRRELLPRVRDERLRQVAQAHISIHPTTQRHKAPSG